MSDTTPRNSITIKKYANRRLYNTATSSYVTLQDLSQMVKDGIEFNVYDAKTSEDITRSVLTQIIVEEEGKSGQQNLLPIGFLRQLIGFYGDSLQWMVPKYLEQSMQVLTGNQEQIRSSFQTSIGNLFPFGTTLEEMSKQNLAMFERTMRMFTPFGDAANPLSALTGLTSSTAAPKAAESAEEVKPAKSCCLSAPPVACKMESAKAEPAPVVAEPEPTNVTSLKPRAEAKPVETAPPSPPAAAAVAAAAPTPMPNVQAAKASAPSGADDMQQKIANLQKQLADLAKSRSH